MVGEKKKKKRQKARQVSVELEASLAPAEAEVGAVAKADQKSFFLCDVAKAINYFCIPCIRF
jgi:hypothetical protein